jgi:hypothetical protein
MLYITLALYGFSVHIQVGPIFRKKVGGNSAFNWLCEIVRENVIIANHTGV